jgi:hypothetical protein
LRLGKLYSNYEDARLSITRSKIMGTGFSYAAEKFGAARRILMLPHPKGEAWSIASAFHEISLAFRHLDRTALSHDPARWVSRLEDLMDTTGINDPNERGTWLTKAESFSDDQISEVSRLVDDLADWFDQ